MEAIGILHWGVCGYLSRPDHEWTVRLVVVSPRAFGETLFGAMVDGAFSSSLSGGQRRDSPVERPLAWRDATS